MKVLELLFMKRDEKSHLRIVGDDVSELFPPPCLSAWHWESPLALFSGPKAMLSVSENTPFSRSVWLALDLARLRLFGLGRVAVPLLMELASMERPATRVVPMLLLERLGRGRLRYWRVVRALGGRYPSSTLVCLPTRRDETKPVDLGIFPSVAEPLVSTAPLEVIVAELEVFLKPNVLVGVWEPGLEGSFLLSYVGICGEKRIFSDTLASSVLPARR